MISDGYKHLAIGSFAEEWRKWSEEARKKAEEVRRLQSLPPKYVIHTVHGTFANKAGWIRPDSGFCGWLNQHLGWRARIEPFTWTGKNSVAARWKAAQDFKRRHLEIKLREFPEAHHVVIAHSHGGNIAFMAIDSPNLAQKVLGVTTLATPFLSARVRSNEKLIDAGTGFFAGLFAGWAVLFFGHWRGLGWSLWPWALAAAACTMGILFMGAWLSQLMERHAKRICAAMPKTALSPEQVAIVRVEADEAIAAITGARLAGILADFIWRVSSARAVKTINGLLTAWDYGGIRSIQEIAKRSAQCSVTGAGEASWGPKDQASPWAKEVRAAMFQAVAIGAVTIFQEGSPNEKFWTMILFGVYGLPAAFAVTSAAIGIPFALLSSMSLLPCGSTVPFAGPYLHMTAEPSPPGSWTVTQFDITGHPKSLFHSEAYEHPLVPWFLADWIKERVKVQETQR